MSPTELERESESPIWRELYNIAVLETNPAFLMQRIAEAEWAVKLRQNELKRSALRHQEKLALAQTEGALGALRNSNWAQ
jgi:hypothetical protein